MRFNVFVTVFGLPAATKMFSVLLCSLTLNSWVESTESGCVSCPLTQKNAYNVHLIPHSHMDLGWLKTVDQYYYGTNAKVTTDSVQYIYDSVVRELSKDERRRFIFAEIGFFSLWWEKRPQSQSLFRQLLERGQIEFVSGGIVMNDEACAHYDDIIDQMSFGLNIIRNLFGKCGHVETGWQIDPFGHSKQFARTLNQMGFQRLFFGRIDYQEKQRRQKEANMEFVWKLDEHDNLTVSVLPNNYKAPQGFCFDISCNDDVLVPDKTSDAFNLKYRADAFVDWIRNNSLYYRSNHLPVTMGEDFNYMDGQKWFANMDLLMDYVNANNYTLQKDGEPLDIRLVYSTPTCYGRASSDQSYSKNEADFFPYAYPDGHSYWTGYFSSRPSFKYMVRWASGIYRAATQILAEIGVSADKISSLRRSLAIAQHHDAITGTAKQFVNDNYVKHLSEGVQQVLATLSDSLGSPIGFCPQLNVSQCELTEHLPPKGIVTVIYNPLAFKVFSFLRFPVKNTNVDVYDEKGYKLITSVTTISDAVTNLAERESTSRFELGIPLKLTEMGFRRLTIKPRRIPKSWRGSSNRFREDSVVKAANDHEVGIGQDGLRWMRVNGRTMQINQTFAYYESSCSSGSRASGAYVFRPNGPKKHIVLLNTKKIVTKNFYEIRQTFSDNVSQNIRIYNDAPYIELDWIVGPINVSDAIGKEIVMVIDSDLFSNATFFTDSNGREEILRVRNFRQNWPLNLSEPESGNYYPINSRIRISDNVLHYTVLTDRAQGASSLQSGSIEIMLHRRCLCDDGFGVDEALNEPGTDGKGLQVRGTMRFYLDEKRLSRLEDLKMTQPFVFFTNEDPSGVGFINASSYEGKIHIVTLKNVQDRHYLLQLENISEDYLQINLSSFLTHPFLSVREMNLAGLDFKVSLRDFVNFEKDEIKTLSIQI